MRKLKVYIILDSGYAVPKLNQRENSLNLKYIFNYMYTEIEQQTLDIDWFFTDSKHIGFVASGGGKLPSSIARSSKSNDLLISYFNSLSISSGVNISPNLGNIISSPVDERHLKSFIKMVEKGFFAFDKTILNNFSNPYYHLVATPDTPLKFKNLPPEIMDILQKTKLNKEIEPCLDVTMIS